MKWTPDTTLTDFYELCYRRQKHAGKSPNTVTDYRVAIRRYRAYFEAAGQSIEPKLSHLTDDYLSDFQAWYVDDLDRAPETPNKYARNIKAIWRYAKRKGAIDYLPDVDRLPTPKHARKTWTPAEFDRLLTAASQLPGDFGGVPAAVFWRAIIMVVTNTASRINAIMQLKVSDVDFEREKISIDHDHTKDNADHRPPLLPVTAEAIRQLLACRPAKRSDRLFACWPYDEHADRNWDTLRDHYKKLLAQAELPASRKFLFHCLRAYTLTRIAAKYGIEAARQFVKHSSLSVTMAYIDFDQIEGTVDIKQVFPEFSGTRPPTPPAPGGPQLRVFRGDAAAG
ncbi:site-specific tyrosine recombinase XerC [Bremerella volcania]|uniref:Site-specific tyrosine recombinase XerC n=1 Tax=Bremerella volcania TaxID=2527984 RepID=A0A518C5E4_9BACT|nr:site-specific integrase [Bremerella volcania]QDU74450.1 site-specific tyrosine recombinase XerC [Bremerella volcania]